MKPVQQSRVGKNGRCMCACIASILEIPEADVPDFANRKDLDFFEAIDAFLKPRGLCYVQIPIVGSVASRLFDEARAQGRVIWGTIEGTSPRGGQHACVARNGELVFDPHPQDGTGRGLVRPHVYGFLCTPKGKAMMQQVASAQARDAEYAKPFAVGNGFEYWEHEGDVYRNPVGNRGFATAAGIPANVRWECTKAHFERYREFLLGSSANDGAKAYVGNAHRALDRVIDARLNGILPESIIGPGDYGGSSLTRLPTANIRRLAASFGIDPEPYLQIKSGPGGARTGRNKLERAIMHVYSTKKAR